MQINRRKVVGSGVLAAGAFAVNRARAQSTTPARQPIKIGQIGVGHAHATKLSVYRNSSDYEVVGICKPDPKLRQQAEKQPAFQGLPWMTEEQLLNTPGLQAVLGETQVRDLLATAERCVAAGMHVHLDKPAGDSLPDYRRLLDQAQRQQLMVQMGYMYRYNPAVVLLRECLAKGWLGDVFEVHTVMSKVVPPASRQELAEFSGGMMFELGCHIIDLVVGVLGTPQQITAFGAHHSTTQADELRDNMLAVFQYPQALATVKTSAMEVNGFARRHFVECGSQGTFHIQPLDNPTAIMTLAQPQGEYRAGAQEIQFPKFPRYVGDAADMAQVIRGEKESQFDYAHDWAVQSSVLAACQAGAS